jgi:Family of unknown function (DUF5681)
MGSRPCKSGNPGGRPKGTIHLADVLERTMQEQTVIVERGRKKRITKAEAIAKRLVNKAIEGDLGAIRMIAAFRATGESGKEQDSNETTAFTEAEQHSGIERIPGTSGKGKPGSDGRGLVEVLREIYGLQAPNRERRPVVSRPPQGSDRGPVTDRDRAQV